MKTPANHNPVYVRLPILSSRNQGWENILVEQFQYPTGEAKTYYSDEHSICLSLAPRPVRVLKAQAGKTHMGAHTKGDFCITPAKGKAVVETYRPLSDGHCLRVWIQ